MSLLSHFYSQILTEMSKISTDASTNTREGPSRGVEPSAKRETPKIEDKQLIVKDEAKTYPVAPAPLLRRISSFPKSECGELS